MALPTHTLTHTQTNVSVCLHLIRFHVNYIIKFNIYHMQSSRCWIAALFRNFTFTAFGTKKRAANSRFCLCLRLCLCLFVWLPVRPLLSVRLTDCVCHTHTNTHGVCVINAQPVTQAQRCVAHCCRLMLFPAYLYYGQQQQQQQHPTWPTTQSQALSLALSLSCRSLSHLALSLGLLFMNESSERAAS